MTRQVRPLRERSDHRSERRQNLRTTIGITTVLRQVENLLYRSTTDRLVFRFMLNYKSLKRILEIKESLEKSLRRLVNKPSNVSSSSDDVISVLKCLTAPRQVQRWLFYKIASILIETGVVYPSTCIASLDNHVTNR